MSLYALKPRFQNMLRPLVEGLAKRGVTANQVTVAAAVLSIMVGAFAAFGYPRRSVFLLVPLWLFIRMAFNAIDGMLAREHGQMSALGAYLNELGDIVSDAALALPFLVVPGLASFELWLFVWVACVVECAGLIGPLAGASRRYDGPFGKSDRALVLGAVALWVGMGFAVGGGSVWLWRVLIALSVVTALRRVMAGVAETR